MQPLKAVTMDNKVVWHNAAKPQLNNVDTDVTLQPSLLPFCCTLPISTTCQQTDQTMTP